MLHWHGWRSLIGLACAAALLLALSSGPPASRLPMNYVSCLRTGDLVSFDSRGGAMSLAGIIRVVYLRSIQTQQSSLAIVLGSLSLIHAHRV